MGSEGTREQIVSSAADLIWRRGYNRTSVDDIVRHARICKGSFYHYFSSKEALGLAVIDVWTEHFGAHIRAKLSASQTPEENLHAILDAMVAAQEESGYLGCPLGRLALEMGDVSEAFQQRLQEGFDGIREAFATYLKAAGLDADEASAQAHYLLATLEGALMLDKVRGGGEVLNGLIAAMKSDVSQRLRIAVPAI
jgi:TetR/AcrR family transcriptional repressor of nem operon